MSKMAVKHNITGERTDSNRDLVLFDLDGTLISGQSQQILLKLMRKEGILSSFDMLKIQFWFLRYKTGLTKNIADGMEKVYKRLEGINSEVLDSLIEQNFHVFRKKIMPSSRRLVENHQKNGDYAIMISSSVEPVVRWFCREFGILEYRCTKLASNNGTFTGKLEGEVLTPAKKLGEIITFLNLSKGKFSHIYYYNDHHSELNLMHFADFPVCVRPDHKLRKMAVLNHWKIID